MNELRNTIITESPSPEVSKPKKGKKPKKISWLAGIAGVLEGSFLARKQVISLLPYLVFLTVIGLGYIFNSNYATHTIIDISKTKKQIEELRFEYINTKAKLMHNSSQSEIARKLEARGLKESKIPPRKIVVTETTK